MSDADIALGIDVGGTFTDVLAMDRRRGALISAFKVPSTPRNPQDGALMGVDRYLERTGKDAAAVFHGTTVGTNALITRNAARMALLTTKGFRDVLALRRHARPRLYDLSPRISPPLAPRERRFEVAERMSHDGEVLVALDDAEVGRLVDLVRDCQAEAVAISLLHAYANDVHERALGAAISDALPDVYVTLSSDVCREFREFERTSTVAVNAFIGPVVETYIDGLESELQGRGIADLSIVKSNGGLTSAANARRYPVHLIESGPAAGIIACAALGEAEDLGDLIAFDMGGTTAKAGVVVGGQPRLSTEFYAARFVDGVDVGGYPIQSPVIDLIEIGAGGGSIAWIDAAGVIKVGPESAGADPGPACYGRGGQRPTVTDAHVAVGHIAADGFGSEDLTIDADMATQVIDEHIARPFGWSVPWAAWGVLRLATANMAEMVRLATLRRGLDPRDFSLVAFGGAGPLHAAEIAREVGVPRIVIPTAPGLFSAIGTMLGEARHDLVQTKLRRVTELGANEVADDFREMEARARDLIAAEGMGDDWQFQRSVDVRFEGQLFELTLPLPSESGVQADLLEAQFRRAYHDAYGYDLPDHAVQLVNLRLIAKKIVYAGGWPSADQEAASGGVRTRQIIDADGHVRDVPVYHRAVLEAGKPLHGPAIIEDFGATIRILDGQTVETRPSGILIVTDEEVRSMSATQSVLHDDPVTFEVVRGGLYAICEEMKSVMMRASFSPLLSLSADLSCAILDHRGDVVAQGNDIPVHLGAMPFSAQGILEAFPIETWRPGDGVLSNDPYSGGSHLPDMTLLTPIFDGNGVVGFSASRVHWPDVGGMAAGSSAVTDEIIKEGIRVPPIRIIKEGEPERDLWTLLFANVRIPEDRVGDFKAQIACNMRGVERVEEQIARYGGDAVRQIFAETQDYSQRMVEVILTKMPDGIWHATHHLDGDGYSEDSGNGPFGISVKAEKRGQTLHFDFAGTDPQAKGPVNAPFAVTASVCYYTILALAGGAVPPNSGAYRAVHIHAPEGTLVNPVYPAPVVAANTETSNRIVDVLLDALAPAMPGRAVAGSYGCAGVFALGGWDATRGRRFVHVETMGGGMGASAQGAGVDGHRVHMGNTMNLPIEATEAGMPLRIEAYELIDDSGGPGHHHGGMGARKVIRALADDVEFSLLYERALNPAPGAAGGGDGRCARFAIEHVDGSTTELSSKTVAGRLSKGEALWIETAGGGGWGTPP